MNDNTIFIHVLKTGGTTINTAMHQTDWQTEVDFNYRHIQKKTKRSNSADIFEGNNFEKYKAYSIFMMVREPVDRLISEYYFIKERQGFMNLLNPKPTCFEDYVTNSQTANFMVGFLLGKKMYDSTPTTREDLNKVVAAIDNLPIYVGIFEKYNESLSYFSDKIGLEWQNNIEAKRMTFRRPKREEISSELQQIILDKNILDKELYDYCLQKFNREKPRKIKQKINFELSKHNHIIPYSKTMIYFDFCTKNRNYLKQNNLFFRELNTFMHGKLRIKDGNEFAATWNATFEEAVNRTFNGTNFAETIYNALKSDTDHLQATINIGQAIDTFFKKEGKAADKFYKALKFDVSMVKRIKTEPLKKETKQGFFAKLFSK